MTSKQQRAHGAFFTASPEADANIGRNVRALREAAGWSQADLSTRLTELGLAGFYPQTILRIEKGQRSLKLLEAIPLAAVLGVDVEDLTEASGADVRASRLVKLLPKHVHELTSWASVVGNCLGEIRGLIAGEELTSETREAAELVTTIYSMNHVVSTVERALFDALSNAGGEGEADGQHPEAP